MTKMTAIFPWLVTSSLSVLLILSSAAPLGFCSSGSFDELILLLLLLLSPFVLPSDHQSSTGNTGFCSSGSLDELILLLLLLISSATIDSTPWRYSVFELVLTECDMSLMRLSYLKAKLLTSLGFCFGHFPLLILG